MPMSVEVWVAIITSSFTILGTIITVIWGNNLTIYRIEQLEQKVNKHNNLIERTYIIEKRLDIDEEKIRAVNNKIKDIEQK